MPLGPTKSRRSRRQVLHVPGRKWSAQRISKRLTGSGSGRLAADLGASSLARQLEPHVGDARNNNSVLEQPEQIATRI